MPFLPLVPLLAAGLALAAPAAAQDTYSDAERTALRAEIRAYLLEHPEVLFEAVAEFENRNAAAQADMDLALIEINAEDIFSDAHSWVGGNLDGDLTLVEFVDYRCSFCRRAFDHVMDFVALDGNVRFVIKEFPILGAQSELSSRLAISVLQLGGDEAYEAVHERLLTLNGDLTETVTRAIAVELDLDPDAVTARMGSDEITAILAENRALAQRLQINGTPTFVMGGPENGQLIRGFLPSEELHNLAGTLRD
ncbi:DsbA family protein [Pararhodobacter sp. SW119]|uniref:DsbA family protein n=1 Tax=Pararhodobacter sp. SW119 TaxID=2780075 RepID=UPI001AE02D66|nr:DsbA family protein [Pararhodobacter sp. SW119]